MAASRRELLGTMAEICGALLDLEPYNPANIKRYALARPVRERAIKTLRRACYDVVVGDRDLTLEELREEVASLKHDLERLQIESP